MPPQPRPPPPLDELSGAIIEQLQQDGRRTYAKIAAAVGLSEAAVRQRVTRLIDSGVMQIVAVTDPMQIGLHRQAMVGVRTEGDITEVADQIVALAQVDYVVITAGSFDLLVEVVCADDQELLDVVGTQISCLPGVVATETFMYLKLRKHTYTWSTVPGRAGDQQDANSDDTSAGRGSAR